MRRLYPRRDKLWYNEGIPKQQGGVTHANVNSKEMFKKAYEGGYAIGAFNVNNMEIIQGITEARRWKTPPSFCR